MHRANPIVFVSLFGIMAPSTAHAAMNQEQAPVGQGEAPALEEIIVTAQKRAENLQDVPISITAVSGEKMAENAVTKIDDLQGFVPNLSLTETGLSTQILIRGIGTGNNPAFEQSVGTYIDGIYYGRSQLLRLPFLDLERVEVLRGPQSILFGKNSIAGALNLTTAAPTKQLEGRATISYSPNGDIAEFTGVISGPLSDRLYGRIAVRQNEESGWFFNTFKNQKEVGRNETAARVSLRWDATDDLRVDFKAEWAEFDNVGRQVEIVRDVAATAGPLAGLNFEQILGLVGYPDAIGGADRDNIRRTEGFEASNNEVQNYTLRLEGGIGELTLTAISGLISYEFEEFYDGDWSAAPLGLGSSSEKYDQFSQEIRLLSPTGNRFEWIAGAFYQTSKLDFSDRTAFPANSVVGALIPPAGPILGTETAREYSAKSNLFAGFAQVTWNVSDRMRVALGGRYTWEEKKGFREINVLDTATGAITTNPIAPIVWSGLGVSNEQFGGHSVSGKFDKGAFSPSVNVMWDVTENVMLYATYSSGYKSGGFDARANSPNFFKFSEERADTVELGLKSSLFGGSAELNFAVYHTKYDDLQTSQYDGGFGFTVANAKETIVQGVEVDGRWAIADSLIMNFAMAYLDHEHTDFTNGNCYTGQIPDGDVVNGVALCDYTGKRGWYTPELSGTLGLVHSANLGSDLVLQSNFDLSYQGKQNVHVNLDPNGEIGSVTRMNFRTALKTPTWELALLVQNITDKQPLTLVSDVPLTSSFGTSTYNAFVSRPRTFYLQASYRF